MKTNPIFMVIAVLVTAVYVAFMAYVILVKVLCLPFELALLWLFTGRIPWNKRHWL